MVSSSSFPPPHSDQCDRSPRAEGRLEKEKVHLDVWEEKTREVIVVEESLFKKFCY